MEPEFIFIASTVWLFTLWFGSIALEATGMERKKARFQSLSALTNTGFTTREAEDVVGHPKRRLIASWLVFLGVAGLILFALLILILLVFGLKPGPMSPTLNILSSLPTVALLVLYWLGVRDKPGTKVVQWLKRSRYFNPELSSREIVHQAGDYSVARLTIGRKAPEFACRIGDSSLAKHGITILAIERGDKAFPFPGAEEAVQAGDHLLCYGKTAEISKLTE